MLQWQYKFCVISITKDREYISPLATDDEDILNPSPGVPQRKKIEMQETRTNKCSHKLQQALSYERLFHEKIIIFQNK